jgi:hypothetical protein
MDFLIRLEESGFGTWVRESPSLWAYPTVLFLHTAGLALVVGMACVIDLRLLGVASRLPLAPFEAFFPILWAGFIINAASGSALLIADATTKLIDPVFYVKMTFIVIAIAITILMQKHAFKEPPSLLESNISARAKIYAGASLFCWAGAITAGRLMAYLGPKARL